MPTSRIKRIIKRIDGKLGGINKKYKIGQKVKKYGPYVLGAAKVAADIALLAHFSKQSEKPAAFQPGPPTAASEYMAQRQKFPAFVPSDNPNRPRHEFYTQKDQDQGPSIFPPKTLPKTIMPR